GGGAEVAVFTRSLIGTSEEVNGWMVTSRRLVVHLAQGREADRPQTISDSRPVAQAPRGGDDAGAAAAEVGGPAGRVLQNARGKSRGDGPVLEAQSSKARGAA